MTNVSDIHTISGLEDYMMELIEANMSKSRTKQAEFNWLKKQYKQFREENYCFSEKEFVKAYYMACVYLYED